MYVYVNKWTHTCINMYVIAQIPSFRKESENNFFPVVQWTLDDAKRLHIHTYKRILLVATTNSCIHSLNVQSLNGCSNHKYNNNDNNNVCSNCHSHNNDCNCKRCTSNAINDPAAFTTTTTLTMNIKIKPKKQKQQKACNSKLPVLGIALQQQYCGYHACMKDEEESADNTNKCMQQQQ